MQVYYHLLNEEEQKILKKIYVFPAVLEKTVQTYRPHLICNHLFEFASLLNNWYTKYSVQKESDPKRKQSMLQLCQKARDHLVFCLDLLGIPTVDKL